MSKLKINREELYSLYMKEIDNICEVCDWKTHFEPKEIISIIAHILEKHENLTESNDYEEGYEAGLNAAYYSSQSSGGVSDPQ